LSSRRGANPDGLNPGGGQGLFDAVRSVASYRN
jgi:hypothetical protein